MTKRKYTKGKLIKNIAQLGLHDDYIYIRNKLWHPGWWQSLQFGYLKREINQDVVYFADRIKEENKNVK